MSAPYGQQPPPQSGPSRPSRGGLDLTGILALAAAGLGVVIYLCSFAPSALLLRVGPALPLFLGAGLVAAATLLPNGRRMLVPAVVLAALGALQLLVAATSDFPGPPPPLGVGDDTSGIVITVLVLGFLQAGALVAAVLLDAGVVTAPTGGWPSRQRGAPSSASSAPHGQYSQGQYPPGQYPPGQHPPPPGQYQYPPGRYGPGPQEPGGYSPQAPAPTAQQPGPPPGQYVPPGQYGQPGPPPQGQYGQPDPPPQGQYGRQRQPGSQGAYGQYEQQPPDSADQGTTQFRSPDPDQRDESEQQDLRRRYGPPDDRGPSGRS